jgi:hypothetical protein
MTQVTHIGMVNVGANFDAAQVEFLKAIDEYKRLSRRPFPTWCEVLAVVQALGYRKVAEPQPLPRYRVLPSSQAAKGQGALETVRASPDVIGG